MYVMSVSAASSKQGHEAVSYHGGGGAKRIVKQCGFAAVRLLTDHVTCCFAEDIDRICVR